MEDRSQIWTPQIVTSTNMISQNKQGEKFAVGDWKSKEWKDIGRSADSFISFYLIMPLLSNSKVFF